MKLASGCMALATVLVFLVANGASSAPLRGAISPSPAYPPTWPNTFYVSFEETNMIKTGPSGSQAYFGAKNTGDLYYDYPNKLQRMDRSTGRYNMFCNSVNYGSGGPCNMYQVNGTRYISWPHQNFCCSCCTEEEGCGMLKPTWVEDAGGEYLGNYFVEDILADSWIIHGNEDNYWYQNRSNGAPLQLVQANDVNYYNQESFKVGPISPSVFTLPDSGCHRSCAKVAPQSVCAKLSSKTAGEA